MNFKYFEITLCNILINTQMKKLKIAVIKHGKRKVELVLLSKRKTSIQKIEWFITNQDYKTLRIVDLYTGIYNREQ